MKVTQTWEIKGMKGAQKVRVLGLVLLVPGAGSSHWIKEMLGDGV